MLTDSLRIRLQSWVSLKPAIYISIIPKLTFPVGLGSMNCVVCLYLTYCTGHLTSPIGNPNYDWMLKSTPQAHAGNRDIFMPRYVGRILANVHVLKNCRGKMFGGCGGMNNMAWARASRAEYDSLDAFAPDAGWSWSDLLPYLKKSEAISAEYPNPYPGISKEQAAQAKADGVHARGTDGPIVVRTNIYPQFYTRTDTLNLGYLQLFLFPHCQCCGRDCEQARYPY
jgi:hypothetical protein